MDYRLAGRDDCGLLARMNQQLIQDEGHRNSMNVGQLEERMRQWLATEYRAAIFEGDHQVVGYALFREQPEEINLRQFFIVHERRRQGLGRQALALLRAQIWPDDVRLTVDVLMANAGAVAFWRSAGYRDYALTLEIVPARK